MFGRVSRYDEHPIDRRLYKDVVGRVTYPSELPISADRSEVSPWKAILPIVVLFFLVTAMSVQLSSDRIFLGWLIHAFYFGLLGAIVYHLCPPQINERVEINTDEVIFERLGVTGYQVERVPLIQYRGVIPITYIRINEAGVTYKEYGAALRHADPTKTVLLTLNPIRYEGLVEHYAQLLSLKPLFEEKFALHLINKRSFWQTYVEAIFNSKSSAKSKRSMR